jgi:hypothetical protein
MTDAELKLIESDLGLSLPPSYRSFVLSFPDELAAAAGDFEFYSDASRLLTLNKELRKTPFFQGRPWPDRLFAIGENGCGDYYFLDLKDSYGAVMFVDHETMDYKRLAPNVAAWTPKLLEEKQNESNA